MVELSMKTSCCFLELANRDPTCGAFTLSHIIGFRNLAN